MSIFTHCVVFTICAFLSVLKPVYGIEITEEMRNGPITSLADDALILHDPDNKLSAEAALKLLNTPDYHSDKVIPLGKQYWLYTPLLNHSSDDKWMIFSFNTLYEELDFYLACSGRPLQSIPRPLLGMDSPTLVNFYQIPVILPKYTTCGLLQRARVEIFNISPARNYLIHSSFAAKQANLSTLLRLAAMGAVFALILYNFLLYISVRDINYLIYTGYALIHFSLITFPNLFPTTLIEFFGGERVTLRLLSVSVIIFFTIFTLRFMQPGIQAARGDPGKKRIASLSSIMFFLNLLALAVMCLFLLAFIVGPMVLPENIMGSIIMSYSLAYILSGLLIPLLSLVVAISGYKPAWVFLPAWSILILSHAVFILDFMGLIDLYGWAGLFVTLAAALEMVLLSLALGMNLKDAYLAKTRAQIARERAELQVGQQEKFISTLSHEIRTPLHAMLGSTTLLGRTELSGKQRGYWSTTHYAAESMYALVDNLLDRTQLKHNQEFGSDRDFDPQRLLETMIQLLRSRAEEKHLHIRLHTHDLPVRLTGKPIVLRRMLINLISNAVKYTDSGEISVSVEWSTELNELHVVVEDAGRGMSVEQLANIKARFNAGVESLYSQNASSGLGLPICFEMIKAVGGDLSLDSKPGQGTKASFTLHMRPSSVSHEQENPAPGDGVALTILVVDDVASNRLIANELLTAAGHAVSLAEDGEQALLVMQEQSFDVVLSDVRMPRLDGVQLLEAIRQQYLLEDLTIVMTSAHFDQKQREQLLAAGANACLTKPYPPNELLAAVQGIHLDAGEKHSSKDIFATLKDELDDDKLATLLQLYKKQIKEDMTRIANAASQQDEHGVRVAAHRIVSASRTLALHENAQAASRIEMHEKNQPTLNWEAFNKLIDQNLKIISFQGALP